MRQPKYQLRMDADLLRRLTEAGTTRVREALERAFPVVPGSTQDASSVVPNTSTGSTGDDSGSTGASETGSPVVPGSTRNGKPSHPVLPKRAAGSTKSVAPEPVEGSPVVPAWKVKLAEQIDKAKGLKAARV